MDKEFFMNTQLQYDHHHPFTTQMPTWQTLSNAMEIQSSQSPDCFLSPHTTTDQFESALSSMVSSPAASTSAMSNENFVIRELIGKLGSICNSGDIHGTHPLPPYIGGSSTNNSCYSTPLSSPPKLGMPTMDQLVKENFQSLGNSVPISSHLPAMPGGPGFAERAARFSSFGSRSFNGRTSPFVVNNNNNLSSSNNNNGQDFAYRSNNNSLVGCGGKLQRVSSTPSLKATAAAENNKNSPLGPGNANNERKQAGNSAQDQGENLNSKENSSVSGQSPPVEIGSNRKRKAAPKSKGKEAQSSQPTNTTKAAENEERSNAKRSKSEESEGRDDGEEKSEGDDKKQSNSDDKQTEPFKDYIHVRARRGQATDSHSLAERVRREKISERMKLLQDLVPGCNKVTGKALMLDEIINYVQSLQRQVEFLSMKLSSVNPRLEFNADNLFSKDHVIQPNGSVPHPMYPLDSLAPTLYGQPHQSNITTGGPMAPCPMDPLNPNLNQNNALQLPQFDGFPNGVPRLTSLCQGDLQSIVQMGYGQNENGLQPSSGTNQTSLMKIEF